MQPADARAGDACFAADDEVDRFGNGEALLERRAARGEVVRLAEIRERERAGDPRVGYGHADAVAGVELGTVDADDDRGVAPARRGP